MFEGHWIKKFYSRHNNHFQLKSIVTMQTICSILVTHLIYKLACCMFSLWQTGFRLTSWLPGGAVTFPPVFERQSHSLYHSCTNWMLSVKETLSLDLISVSQIFTVCLFSTWICPCLFSKHIQCNTWCIEKQQCQGSTSSFCYVSVSNMAGITRTIVFTIVFSPVSSCHVFS